MSSSAVLALDPGQKVGWAWDDGSCGTVDLSFATDLGATAATFHAWLCDALWCRRPRLLLIERPFGRGAFTADLPVVLCGVAHMAAHCFGVERRELSPSSIKKAITGNGRASKQAVLAGVRLEGWDPDTDHAADAAALIVAHRIREVAAHGPARVPTLRMAVPVEPLNR